MSDVARFPFDISIWSVHDHDFLVDNAMSVPDILLAPIIASVRAMPDGATLLAPFSNLRRANEKFVARPSYLHANTPPEAAQ